MSTVRGTISVDIEFSDSTATEHSRSRKTIVMRDSEEYTATTGIVAVFEGTAGTAQTTLFSAGPVNYQNADGVSPTPSAINRIAYIWDGGSGSTYRTLSIFEDIVSFGQEIVKLRSYGDHPAISYVNNFTGLIRLDQSNATGSYKVILYSLS